VPQLKFEGLKFVIALGPAPWPRFAGQNGPAFSGWSMFATLT
jgi:hypothetical protein